MSPFEITWRRDFHHVIPFQYCNCRRTCVILPMRHARDATRHWNINNVRKNSLQNKYSFVVVLVILSWSTFLPFLSVCDCDMSHLTMLWIYLTFKRPNEVKLLFFFFFTLHISIFFFLKKERFVTFIWTIWTFCSLCYWTDLFCRSKRKNFK